MVTKPNCTYPMFVLKSVTHIQGVNDLINKQSNEW